MKKSSLSELFLTVTGFRKNQNGNGAVGSRILDTAPAEDPRTIHRTLLASTSSSTRFLTLLTIFSICLSVFFFSKFFWADKQNSRLSEQLAALEAQSQSFTSEKASLERAIAGLKKENESLLFRLDKLEVKVSSVSEEKTYLEEILINRTKEIESIRKVSPKVASGEEITKLTQRMKENDDEIKRLQELNKNLTKKLDRLYQTTNEKMTEINVAKIALEDTITEARKTIDDEWNTVDLGSIRVAPAASAPLAVPAASSQPKEQRKVAKNQGRVLAVNGDYGFIIVDIGKVDGITQNSNVTVTRGGKPIATLTVLEIRDVMTACNIKDLVSGQKIEINDSVSFQK